MTHAPETRAINRLHFLEGKFLALKITMAESDVNDE